MDGRGRWIDNRFIERLWRSVKYEDVYLRDYLDGLDLGRGLGQWFADYNESRPHQALTYACPGDPRNSLLSHYVRLLEGIRPKWFVMENVEGIHRETRVSERAQRDGHGTVGLHHQRGICLALPSRLRPLV